MSKKIALPEQDYLNHVLNYNENSGILTWKKSNKIAGSVRPDKRIHVRVNKKYYMVHRIIWKMYYGKDPKDQLDHINRNPMDNKIVNLREVSDLENKRNVGLRNTNTSGYTGVGWHKLRKKWQARIQHKQDFRHLGLFNKIEDAIEARKNAEIEYGFHKINQREIMS